MNNNNNNNRNNSINQSTSPQSPRHWHGSVGDRYEHHNVWVRGGPPQAYHPRSASISSEGEASSMADQQGTTKKENASPPRAGERRRSSQPMLFSGLSTQKRDPLDPNMTARRASWKEQVNSGGFLSKWWDGYTKGS